MAFGQVDIPKVLYLKDGGFLKESLVRKPTTEYVWQLKDGTQINFPNEIVKYVKEQKENFQYIGKSRKRRIKKTKGYFSRIMAGSLIGSRYNNNNITESINFTFDYQINSKVSLGIGSGYDRYNPISLIIPLYLDLAGDIFNWAISPYYKLSAGYGFASPTKDQRSRENFSYKGGFLVHPSIGVKFYTRHDLAWFIDFGY